MGMIRMILDFAFVPPLCGEPDTRPEGIIKILGVHYLHFGIILFLLSCLVTTVVSLLTKPIDEKYVSSNKYGRGPNSATAFSSQPAAGHSLSLFYYYCFMTLS